jgi:hypothetical protein
MKDPNKQEMINFLKKESINFNAFDAEAAIFWYAYDHHSGQWSNLYSVLSTSQYKPGPFINKIEQTDESTQIMYNLLVSNYENK